MKFRIYLPSGEQVALNTDQVTKWNTGVLVNNDTMQPTGNYALHVFTADGREQVFRGEASRLALEALETEYYPVNDPQPTNEELQV